jgi:hypothetical protein
MATLMICFLANSQTSALSTPSTATKTGAGYQLPPSFGSDGELVAGTLKVSRCCTFELKVKALSQGGDSEVHFGPCQATWSISVMSRQFIRIA